VFLGYICGATLGTAGVRIANARRRRNEIKSTRRPTYPKG